MKLNNIGASLLISVVIAAIVFIARGTNTAAQNVSQAGNTNNVEFPADYQSLFEKDWDVSS